MVGDKKRGCPYEDNLFELYVETFLFYDVVFLEDFLDGFQSIV